MPELQDIVLQWLQGVYTASDHFVTIEEGRCIHCRPSMVASLCIQLLQPLLQGCVNLASAASSI
jgi:hypothetical protein